MSIQSSINQMLGNVGLLANTFQFQKQINKTEDISSQVAQLNEQKAQLEADKAKFKTDSDKERAKLIKDRGILEGYADFNKLRMNAMLKGVPLTHPDASKFDSWSGNIYDLGNAIASNVAQQRVDAERENKRKNQFDALQKAFQNIGMGGGNDNG